MAKSVVITGIKSRIAYNFIRSLKDETVIGIRCEDIKDFLEEDMYLFCQGLLYPKLIEEQTQAEQEASIYTNYQSIKDACEMLLETNPNCRICIIGSESAYRGSYDGSYAEGKKMIHEYVQDAKIRFKNQQIVAISPTIILDASMTRNREDQENVIHRMKQHPKERWLFASEVAMMAKTLLYEQPYINKTVIRMHGGLDER